MSADYKVEAELVVNAKAAAKGLAEVSSKLTSFGGALRGSNSAFGSMVAQAVAFGGAYLGVSAMVGGFTRLASSAFQFQKEVGGAQLGLQTIMAQVERSTNAMGQTVPLGFERANVLARATYQKLQEMAVVSSATSQELLGIYQATYGAARSAGASMEKIDELTQNAATAAAALGVDFQQASRDMGAMLRGGAGLDVKLFSALRAMNAINMDAQAFNRLAPERRVEVIANALRGFEAANEAYGKSLPGALSTTTDLFELFRGAFFGPAFAKMAELLNELNTTMIANKATILAYLTVFGRRFRDFLMEGVEKARAAFGWITAHWDEISQRVHAAVETFKRTMPIAMEWAKTAIKLKIAATALGLAFQGAGAVTSAIGGLTSLAGTLAQAGVIGGGAAAAGAAGAGGAAAGGTMAAVGTALSALAVPFLALAAAAMAVWVAFEDFPILATRMKEGWDMLVSAGADLWEGLKGIWDFLRPMLTVFGALLGGAIVGAFKILAGVVKVVALAFRIVGALLGWVGNHVLKPMGEAVGYAMSMLVSSFGALGTAFSKFVDKIKDWLGWGPRLADSSRGLGTTQAEAEWERQVRDYEEHGATPVSMFGSTPGARTTVHNDFRGSKITVEQSFREADPDRVAHRMIEDINRFAEQRIQSGFAPAFSR